MIRDQALVVTDAREDPELADDKAIDDIGVIAYAGVPLRSGHSHLLGSLAAIHPDSPSREDVEQIRDTAGRAAELTSQLLAFSRQQVLQPRVVDLNDVVRRSERILQRTIGEDVEVVTELTEEPCTVRLDPVQFEHVILNLAVNARDAMPEGGRLGVSTRRLDPEEPVPESLGAGQPHVALEVADTGHGMDTATLDRALEPFFTTKDVGKGTGLGLSTVYGIVKQSDGALTVDSEPGAGTRITIVLPYTDEAPAPEPDASRPGPEPAAEDAVVLLVEDDDGVRRLAHRVLTRRGLTVLTVARRAPCRRPEGHLGGHRPPRVKTPTMARLRWVPPNPSAASALTRRRPAPPRARRAIRPPRPPSGRRRSRTAGRTSGPRTSGTSRTRGGPGL